MWLFSVDGYISVVEYAPHHPLPKTKKDAKRLYNDEEKALGETYQPATIKHYSSHLLVRARVEEDLTPLADLTGNKVVDKPSADYRFRLLVPRTTLAEYVSGLITGIDYDSHVKETINSRAPKIPGGRYNGMMRVWSATSDWQPTPPYSGKHYGTRAISSYGGWGDDYSYYGNSSKPGSGKSYSSAPSSGGGGAKGHWEGGKWVADNPTPARKWIAGATIDGRWKPGHYEGQVWVEGTNGKSGRWVDPPADIKAKEQKAAADKGPQGLVAKVEAKQAAKSPESPKQPTKEERDVAMNKALAQATVDSNQKVADAIAAIAEVTTHGQSVEEVTGTFDENDRFIPDEADDEGPVPNPDGFDDESAMATRAHNEAVAALVIDRLVEDYGAENIGNLAEHEVAAAFREVLSDLGPALAEDRG